MQRAVELIDVWFDSGAMPYAQWHYPFENVDEFKTQYPADFICEALTRREDGSIPCMLSDACF